MICDANESPLTVKDVECLSAVVVTIPLVKPFLIKMLSSKYKVLDFSNSDVVFKSLQRLFNISFYPIDIKFSNNQFFSFMNYWNSDIELGYDYTTLCDIYQVDFDELLEAKSKVISTLNVSVEELDNMYYFEFYAILIDNALSAPKIVGDITLWGG